MKSLLKWSWVVLSNLVGIVVVPIPMILMTLILWAFQIFNRDWPLLNTWSIFWNESMRVIRYQCEWARGNLS